MPLFVVTGAHGFIGTNIAEKILTADPSEIGFEAYKNVHFSDFDEKKHQDKGCSVIASDLSGTLNRDTARRFLGSARYRYVDYEELISVLRSLPTKPDIVIHNGACSSTTETNPDVFSKLNVGYSQALWEYCAEQNIPFIYASSAATYGDGKLGFSDKKEDCHKYIPLNLYGKSKLDFDLWALKQEKTPPTWFGLRYFNVFGQFESHKGGQASMVYHGYNQATRTGKIRLFESNSSLYQDGEQLRDFVYVDDLVAVTMKLVQMCLQRKQSKNKPDIPDNGLFLNVGRGVAETWNDLAKKIFSALALPESIEYIPMPVNIMNQYQNYTCADLTTLRSLGVKHEFSTLDFAVAKYVQKHLMRGQ
ncbi:ADP-glyceromanno-heptose 6-epimerase [Spirobacillus cienkowskii]|uniref:ADP-glyceromanno-heptose 6-epimerase n=1 Tax=Spirobacillus cienkowskii TaxID=495820 RepID=UPI0030CFEE15